MSERAGVKPSDMSAFWMPFHMNRQFKSAPRLLASVKGCATRRTTGGTFSRHSRTVALERAAYAGRSEAHLLCELGFGGGGYHAKVALPYYLSRGEGPRTWFFGRERGYHGMGFGGVSVGGSAPNNKAFSGGLLPAIVHLPHTLNIKEAAVAGDLQHARRPAGVREEPFNANPVGMLDSLISFACAPSRRT